MPVNLLTIKELEPPMGDLGIKPTLSFVRALWTAPIPGEETAPEKRIIHAQIFQAHQPVKLNRLGIRRAAGYHKCGSRQDLDWVVSFRLLVPDENGWRVHLNHQNLPAGKNEEIQWFDLAGLETATVLLEVRRCGIDAWWPSWNLVSGAFLLEGEAPQFAPRDEKILAAAEVNLAALPPGIQAEVTDGQVRFQTPFLQVGFYLNRTGFSFFGLDDDGRGKTETNLLRIQPGIFYQGVQLHLVGHPAIAAPLLRYNVRGTTQVRANHVIYDLELGNSGVAYQLDWEILPERLVLKAERIGQKTLRAWHSSAWYWGMRATATPTHFLGKITRTGETGLVELPAILHAPRFGSLRIESNPPTVLWRADAWRPMDMILGELKIGEIPQSEGDYLLPAGHFSAQIEFKITRAEIELKEKTPVEIKRALQKTTFTALTYRPDTATLSNNGASIHCPICLDNWSALATRIGRLLPNLAAIDLFRDSLERWLTGGPGYSSGRLLFEGKFHPAEDEYLMTGAACLLGLADFLAFAGTPDWLHKYRNEIKIQIDQMRARDLDNDGLIESPYRTGVSGTGQWSTNWFDVIAFGWKDAFSNAVLFDALEKLARELPRFGATDLAAGLADWAARLKTNYFPTFFNKKTGWLAGWRCAENKLHDYAFLAINGVAISKGLVGEKIARPIMQKLWQEIQRVKLPDPQLGLPGNLWHIPDEDLADIMQGYPLGFYQNGGRTHSQTRHFVNALFAVGMREEAEYLLKRLCAGLADGLTFGGNGSGVDWRFWDDRPSGYEGLLTDQFGILAVALERYRNIE
jgi:hypothetical protein